MITLKNDTLILKDNDSYILYSQFSNLITRIKEFPKKNTTTEKRLINAGFFKSIPNRIVNDSKWNGFIALTLLVSRRCNLDCIYCYASPGPNGPIMSEELAVNSVDWFVNQNPLSKIRVTFHGGGEPTLAEDVIRVAVDRVESIKKDKSVNYFIVSNGTCSKEFLDWMIKKKFGISFSVDGPPEIQNRNRPFFNGTESSHVVEENIKHMLLKGRPPGIRLTYSTIDNISKIVEYFIGLGIKNIHLEPLFPYGRYYDETKFGKKSGYDVYSPDLKQMVSDFVTAIDICKKYKVRVFNSHLGHFRGGISYFCGVASAKSMIVTHDGLLTGCLEVVDSKSKDIDIFKVGNKIPNTNKFKVDMEKVKFFRKRHVDSLKNCKECFARYTCSGGCAVKAVRSSQGFFGRDISYCGFTKAIVPILIKRIAKLNKI